MKTVKEQFESILPMTINCGCKKKVRKFLNSMGCKVGKHHTGNWPMLVIKRDLSISCRVCMYEGPSVSYSQIKTLIKQYKAELKQPEFTYPMYFRSNTNNQLVKFTSLVEGTVVEKGTTTYSENVGTVRTNYLPHTEDCWAQVPHDPDTGFYDKQPILITDYLADLPDISLWDNINKRAFSEEGSRNGFEWEYYWPINKLDEAIKPYLSSLED